MSSGPIVALVLEKTNAIAAWRALIGPTNSNAARAEAEAANPLDDSKWSLRALFGTDGQKNACHGSDSTWKKSERLTQQKQYLNVLLRKDLLWLLKKECVYPKHKRKPFMPNMLDVLSMKI